MGKALLINGSPHLNGPTVNIMKMIEDKIVKTYTSEWANTYELNIKPCIGCFKCRPNSECVLKQDDSHLVGKKITETDLLIIGSPVYWGNITAPLKMLFDRNVTTFVHFLEGREKPKLNGKKGIIIVTGGTGPEGYMQINQGGGAIQAIKTVLDSGGIKLIGVLNIHSSWKIEDRKKEILDLISKIKIDEEE